MGKGLFKQQISSKFQHAAQAPALRVTRTGYPSQLSCQFALLTSGILEYWVLGLRHGMSKAQREKWEVGLL